MPDHPPSTPGPAADPRTLDKLHLGCGLFAPPTWLNVDGSLNALLAGYPRLRRGLAKARLIPRHLADVPWKGTIRYHDLRKPLPWPDGRFSAVYASHLLEHLYFDEGQRLLRECFRVLKPGGHIRLVVPDFAQIIGDYTAGRTFPEKRWKPDWPNTPADTANLQLFFRDPVFRPGGFAVKIYDALYDLHGHKWMYDERSLIAHITHAGFANARRRGFHDSSIPDLEGVEMRDRVEDKGLCVEAEKK
jgi:predicted SAM-dependent methyltransferase